MRSKFSSMVKIHKNNVDKIEQELVAINTLIANKELYIESLFEQIKVAKPPLEVKLYREFLVFQNTISTFRSEIEQEKGALDALNMQKTIIEDKYKNAKIEYEKLHYLHTQELSERTKKLSVEEQKRLDEYGGILHYARNS